MRSCRARGANLVEYLILLGAIALFSLVAVVAFSKALAKKLDEEGKCVASFDCGGGGGGGALPGVGSDASGSQVPPAAPPPPAASPSDPGRRTWEATAAQSKDGDQKFFTVKSEVTGTRAEVTASAADMTYKGKAGELNAKLFTGKVSGDWGGAKVEGAMIEATAKTTVLGASVEAKGAHMAGEAGFQLTKGPDGFGPKAGIAGWVFRGEASAGEMDPKSSGNVKVTGTGAIFGAGAESGLTFNDSDGDGHPEVEATLKLGFIAGAGLQVRVESPEWLSWAMGWGNGPGNGPPKK